MGWDICADVGGQNQVTRVANHIRQVMKSASAWAKCIDMKLLHAIYETNIHIFIQQNFQFWLNFYKMLKIAYIMCPH